jgi:hypothetical protein
MNRNESPRLSNKLYEILLDIITIKGLINNFSSEFCEKLKNDDDMYVLNITTIDNKHYFKGYPIGNYLKIFTKILELWYKHGFFPISFVKIDAIKV